MYILTVMLTIWVDSPLNSLWLSSKLHGLETLHKGGNIKLRHFLYMLVES